MQKIDVRGKIRNLGVSLPPVETFWEMGDMTALRQNKKGEFYRANFERGLLLYALVVKFKPRVILEFGTGRGYGALCMARALVEHQLPGTIYSIDKRTPKDRWAWQYDNGSGPKCENLSWEEIWPKYFEASWLKRIECLNGTTADVMATWKVKGLPKVDFAFIDGGHDFSSVKHDFYSVIEVVSPAFQILFDDYVDKPGFGIRDFIDKEVAPVFETECVVTDRRWSIPENDPKPMQDYGMVFIDSSTANRPIRDAFPVESVREFLVKHRRYKQVMTAIKAPIKMLLNR